MKEFIVYLYRAPDCIRGWLAYLRPYDKKQATLSVIICAEDGPKAKNKAITSVNHGFTGLEIVSYNHTGDIWGINNFPELKEQLLKREGGSRC